MRLDTFNEKQNHFLVSFKAIYNDLINTEEGQDFFPLRGEREGKDFLE